ncbi:nuclear transport factor 2 family protein [Shewanella intestini]|uniref:Nuclear transport factor 2 family protein n=1 Tax=Shewanella intestini TaxID=2017544 RepID=A0ABS5I2K7_9GAMM|nr:MULTISPECIES: nuclear transport factor 2 family protein [Shewanella]MBR9728262.1 nuclear transport factor 2 family protein [Shewanella intestini]MRG35727.1 hypothetical protein [Shewanella sp. XMDDZSB0408]
MSSHIINKLGVIAMLVTTVSAFDCFANEPEQLPQALKNANSQTQPTQTDAQITKRINSSLTIDNAVKTESELVSNKTQSVITNISDNEHHLDPAMSNEKETQQINSLLNQLHESATTANWQRYFSLFHPKAVFLGTDATERWDMVSFRKFAEQTQGWRYDLKSRKLIKVDNTVVFDEQLYSPSYGLSRGTGALVKTQAGWKVLQYHLSFPIPNDKAKRITTLIKQ